jgi:hypothetical protein
MFSIKISHEPSSKLITLYLNEQAVNRVGGPGVRCTLTLIHPPVDGPALFFCNSLFGPKISARHREFDGWWSWRGKSALPASTPEFSGLMPKLAWSGELRGFILKLDLRDWDLGMIPTEEEKSALRSALNRAEANLAHRG